MSGTATFTPEVDISDQPLKVIHDRLSQAHAILDLLYSLTTNHSCAEEHIETLGHEAIGTAVHSVMLRISEAIEATKRIEVKHV